MKIKSKDVKAIREGMHADQNGICTLCTRPIKKEHATLDHCHDTGHIRSVLHSGCNWGEGLVGEGASKAGMSKKGFLKAVLDYWEKDYSHNPIHHTHKNKEEKAVLSEIRALKKRMYKAKRASTKQRLKAKIRKLEGK